MCEWVNVAYSKKRLECSLSVEKLGINNSPFTIESNTSGLCGNGDHWALLSYDSYTHALTLNHKNKVSTSRINQTVGD